jgi:hypothetical protein
MKLIIAFFVVIALHISTLSPAFAGAEAVYIYKVLESDDKAIIMRRNGEAYLIEKGVGCLSLWRYEEKTALVVSSGLFAGIGSSLVIPDEDQECRIWNAEQIR